MRFRYHFTLVVLAMSLSGCGSTRVTKHAGQYIGSDWTRNINGKATSKGYRSPLDSFEIAFPISPHMIDIHDKAITEKLSSWKIKVVELVHITDLYYYDVTIVVMHASDFPSFDKLDDTWAMENLPEVSTRIAHQNSILHNPHLGDIYMTVYGPYRHDNQYSCRIDSLVRHQDAMYRIIAHNHMSPINALYSQGLPESQAKQYAASSAMDNFTLLISNLTFHGLPKLQTNE